MGTPRKLTDQQRAAHLMLPLVAEILRELKTDYDGVAEDARKPKQSNDATADWREMAAKAEGRYQGAGRVAAMLQALARG